MITTDQAGLQTILLVDDDREDWEFFQDALSAVAADVVLKTAENGLEALHVLRSQPQQPGLIFLDLNMPVKNGYECLSDLKQDKLLKNIPVIIFSTSLEQGTANDVYNSGASLYIVKPNSFQALKDILSNVLALNWLAPIIPSRESFIYRI